MKLSSLVNTVRMRFREAENFIRYPLQTISRLGMGRLQDEYEKVEFTGKKEHQNQPQAEGKYQEIPANTNNGKKLDRAVVRSDIKDTAMAVNIAVAERLAKRQSRTTETIPHLPKSHEIKGGKRGRYRVGDLLKDGERVRFYEGFHVLNNKPILIKEYLLPDKDFNQKESNDRKKKFDRISNINLKNGAGQDFRLISPWDAIAPSNEKRCYLILEQTFTNGLTLRDYLAENGPMTCKQVRQVLYQILQTLWFLHNQKLRLSNEEIQASLPHGNLTLDSLVIIKNQPSTNFDEPQFFIYVGDLALWEDLFKPPNSKTVHHSAEEDLIDLGYVSFYLLAGTTINQSTGETLDPKQEEQWPIVKDVALKRFIHHLLGIDKPFANAFEARQALLDSPIQYIKEQVEETKEPEQIAPNKKSSLWLTILTILLLAIAAGFIAQMIWMGWESLITKKEGVPIFRPRSGIKAFSDVPKVPTGNINYTTEADGIWHYVLNNSFGNNSTLEEELKNREPRLKNYQFSAIGNDVIADLRADRADFALTSYIEKLPKELEQTIVAYDGLLVFVAFSDHGRDTTIPKTFQGKISLEELRDLYRSGEIKNWQPPDKFNKKIKLYIPIDNEQALQVFAKVVLKNQSEIARFNSQVESKKKELRKQQDLAINKMSEQMYRQRMRRSQRNKAIERKRQEILNNKLDERDFFGKILTDFETKKTVSIGFGLLSRVFDQCSVYPLAISNDDQAVQVLISLDKNKDKPLYETMDLCRDKGSYQPNIEAFISRRYPLVVPLVVVYHKKSLKGENFAKLLLTDEGQNLLSAAGLVPVRKLNDD